MKRMTKRELATAIVDQHIKDGHILPEKRLSRINNYVNGVGLVRMDRTELQDIYDTDVLGIHYFVKQGKLRKETLGPGSYVITPEEIKRDWTEIVRHQYYAYLAEGYEEVEE